MSFFSSCWSHQWSVLHWQVKSCDWHSVTFLSHKSYSISSRILNIWVLPVKSLFDFVIILSTGMKRSARILPILFGVIFMCVQFVLFLDFTEFSGSKVIFPLTDVDIQRRRMLKHFSFHCQYFRHFQVFCHWLSLRISWHFEIIKRTFINNDKTGDSSFL